MCAHLGLEDDVRVARVELTLVGLVCFLLLDHSKLLDAPDLKANLLADTLEAGVEDSGHAGGGLEAWAQSTVSDQTAEVQSALAYSWRGQVGVALHKISRG